MAQEYGVSRQIIEGFKLSIADPRHVHIYDTANITAKHWQSSGYVNNVFDDIFKYVGSDPANIHIFVLNSRVYGELSLPQIPTLGILPGSNITASLNNTIFVKTDTSNEQDDKVVINIGLQLIAQGINFTVHTDDKYMEAQHGKPIGIFQQTLADLQTIDVRLHRYLTQSFNIKPEFGSHMLGKRGNISSSSFVDDEENRKKRAERFREKYLKYKMKYLDIKYKIKI